jgi:hypothetical protein
MMYYEDQDVWRILIPMNPVNPMIQMRMRKRSISPSRGNRICRRQWSWTIAMILPRSITWTISQLGDILWEETSVGCNHLVGNVYAKVFQNNRFKSEFFTVVCSDDNCPSRVHMYCPKWDTKRIMIDFVLHTSVIQNMLLDHRNLTSTLLARI